MDAVVVSGDEWDALQGYKVEASYKLMKRKGEAIILLARHVDAAVVAVTYDSEGSYRFVLHMAGSSFHRPEGVDRPRPAQKGVAKRIGPSAPGSPGTGRGRGKGEGDSGGDGQRRSGSSARPSFAAPGTSGARNQAGCRPSAAGPGPLPGSSIRAPGTWT